MKQRIFIFLAGVFCMLSLIMCSKEGERIPEPDICYIKFTTYTIDTFKFRVLVNGVILTDSLLTPVGSETRLVNFVDSMATLRIENAITNSVYLDSTIILKPAQLTISIVQFLSGQTPFLPPIPRENSPAPGNYKIRVQYVEPQPSTPGALVPFRDSVECILRLNSVSFDTIVLGKYESSPYYEAPLGTTFSARLLVPGTTTVIDNATNNLSSSTFTPFNTAILFATQPVQYTVRRIY